MGLLGKFFGNCRNDEPRSNVATPRQASFNRVADLKKPVASAAILQTLRHIDLYPIHFYNKISKSAQEEVIKWAYEVLFYVNKFYDINDNNILLSPDMSGISKDEIIKSIKVAHLVFMINNDARIESLYAFLIGLIDVDYLGKEKDDLLMDELFRRNRHETGSYTLTSKNQKIMDEVISRKTRWFHDWEKKVVDDAKRHKQGNE